MKLYDEVILHWGELIAACPNCNVEVSGTSWPDVGNENMILRSDMAYELGGSSNKFKALGGTALTDDEKLVPKDEIIVVGNDLQDIKEDTSYARLAMVRVKSEEMGEGNTLYNAIRKIEYTKYHVNPKGFMMRVSSSHERECARVSKQAIADGMTFKEVGNVMIDAFHKNPNIEAVKLVFITDPNFDYDALQKEIELSEGITKTIDHILKNATMDCHSCSLQEICDEVEGLKELHFGSHEE